MQITSASHNEALSRERSQRLAPLVSQLAEEGRRWIGTTGPKGEGDKLTSIEHRSDHSGMIVVVRFEYPTHEIA